MDVLEKAYDYIDYTLTELSKLQENCVSLLYFFKVFSPAGELAQKILLDHQFIQLKVENNVSIVCITAKGNTVVSMGGVREYLAYLDGQTITKKLHIRKVRKLITYTACILGAVAVTGYVLRKA